MFLYYAILLFVRVGIAPFLPGYIHPDEFFQGGQELWFGCNTSNGIAALPWEFQPQHALRSILPPFVMTWMPLKIYATIFKAAPLEQLSGQEVLVVPRIACALASIVLVDGTIWKLTRQSFDDTAAAESKREIPLSALLLASAWPTLVMLSRPFSNTMETFCLTMLFRVLLSKFLSNNSKQATSSIFNIPFAIQVGITCALGIFSRFTFAFFAAPVLLYLLYYMILQSQSQCRRVVYSLFWMAVSFLSASALIIYIDTQYYQDTAAQGQSQDVAVLRLPFLSMHMVLTPLNALLYNSQVSNLKDHGLHPRWTHGLVNMFILYGPLTLLAYLSILRSPSPAVSGRTRNSSTQQPLTQVSQATILMGLAFLSAAPHQEPRFLLPLLIPLVLVGGNAKSLRSSHFWPLFVLLWIVFNVILTTLYGLLHQGGVVRSLLEIGSPSSLADRTPAKWIYWRTYMPPTFLARRSSQRDNDRRVDACLQGNVIVDLKGSSPESLWEALAAELACATPESDRSESRAYTVVPYLKEEDFVFADKDQCILPGGLYDCKFVAEFGPHLTTEDFPSIEGTNSTESLYYELFVLGMYEISCKQ